MKTNIYQGFAPFIIILLLWGLPNEGFSQGLTVNATSTGSTVLDCGTREINVTVSGGVGPYEYYYSIVGGGAINSVNTPNYIIDPQPNAPTTYSVLVLDHGGGSFGTTTVDVVPQLTGAFNTSIPNVFTPNGDGLNDVWYVAHAPSPNLDGPLNAYRYELTILTAAGGVVKSEDFTVPSGGLDPTKGVWSGDINWDGRSVVNGVMYPQATYFYIVKLYNCLYPSGREFKGSVYLLP